ncbi:MAG: GntR family transcriptional regulator [Limnohabitans sp.]
MNTTFLPENTATPAVQPVVASASFSPLYQQIKSLVLQSLQAGEWKPGDPIPSEFELAARYKVSQGTVRKAIDELAKDHLLVRRQGKGTFVATHAEQQVQFRFLKLKPDNPRSESQGPAEREIIDCKRLRALPEVAQVLGLRSGETVFQVRRVLSFDKVPTIFEDIWLPGTAFKGLTAERLRADTRPMYAMFESDFGIRMVRAQERLRAVLPSTDVCEWLKVANDTPLLKVERMAFTYHDMPMEWRIGVYRTDTRHYLNELN